MVQMAKKTTNVGTEIINAIKEPLAAMSVMVSFFTGGSANIFR